MQAYSPRARLPHPGRHICYWRAHATPPPAAAHSSAGGSALPCALCPTLHARPQVTAQQCPALRLSAPSTLSTQGPAPRNSTAVSCLTLICALLLAPEGPRPRKCVRGLYPPTDVASANTLRPRTSQGRGTPLLLDARFPDLEGSGPGKCALQPFYKLIDALIPALGDCAPIPGLRTPM